MIQRRAFLATAAASATFAARLRRAYGAPVSIPGVPVDAIANIERLRTQAIAGMKASRGRIATAVNLSTQALDAGETLIRSVRLHINEAQMHDLLNYLDYDADAIYTLAAAAAEQPGMAELALRCAMARKGRFTREQFFAQSIWMQQDAAKQPALVAALQAARRRFTQAVEAELANDMEAAAAQIVSIQDQLNMSRQQLLNIPIPSPDDAGLDMGVDNLIFDVDFGEILVVYVAYNSLQQLGGAGSSAYLGIVAQAGAPAVILPLGAATAIEPAAAAFATQAADPSSNPAAAAQSLYALIFAPLTSHFVSSQFTTRTLLVSPDGSLFQVPFAALQDQSGAMLFDSHPIQILDSPLEASLVGTRTNSQNAVNLVAFANPALPASAIALGTLPLQEAEHEATDIAALWPSGDAQVFTGPAATPDQLMRQAPNAGILHIACHGQLAYSPVTPYATSNKHNR